MSDPDRDPDIWPRVELVHLVGVRHVRSSEPDEAVQWQEGLIKQLTDGEPMEVREIADSAGNVPLRGVRSVRASERGEG